MLQQHQKSLTASVRQASEATEQITMAMDEISSGATTQTTSVENGAMLLFNVTEGIQHVANKHHQLVRLLRILVKSRRWWKTSRKNSKSNAVYCRICFTVR